MFCLSTNILSLDCIFLIYCIFLLLNSKDDSTYASSSSFRSFHIISKKLQRTKISVSQAKYTATGKSEIGKRLYLVVNQTQNSNR